MLMPRAAMPAPRAVATLPTSAVRIVVEALGASIVEGRYKPGETIPFEEELAQERRVSRTTLREAIKVLSGKGLLRTARRYGTKVCQPEEWNTLDPDVLRWHLTCPGSLPRVFADLVEVRQIIEPNAAELAAQRASGAEVEALLRAAANIEAGGDDAAATIAADVEFHSVLLKASHNVVIASFAKTIAAMLRVTFEAFAYDIGRFDPNPAQHYRIARAVAARDGAEARRETLELLERGRALAGRLLTETRAGARSTRSVGPLERQS